MHMLVPKGTNNEVGAFEETEDDPFIGGSKNEREKGYEQPSNNEEATTTIEGEGQGYDKFFDFEITFGLSDLREQ